MGTKRQRQHAIKAMRKKKAKAAQEHFPALSSFKRDPELALQETTLPARRKNAWRLFYKHALETARIPSWNKPKLAKDLGLRVRWILLLDNLENNRPISTHSVEQFQGDAGIVLREAERTLRQMARVEPEKVEGLGRTVRDAKTNLRALTDPHAPPIHRSTLIRLVMMAHHFLLVRKYGAAFTTDLLTQEADAYEHIWEMR